MRRCRSLPDMKESFEAPALRRIKSCMQIVYKPKIKKIFSIKRVVKKSKEIDPIDDQERALHEVQRNVRKSVKDQDDKKRAAERASPEKAAERADNQREFDEKQKAAAARAADLEQRRKDAPKRAQENKAGTQLD